MKRITLGIAVASFGASLLAQTADDFLLVDKAASKQYGPYHFANGVELFDGQLTLTLNTNDTFNLKGFVRGIKRTYGPFASTNNAQVLIGTRDFTFVRGSELTRLQKKQKEFQESQKAKGLVEFQGEWIPEETVQGIKAIHRAIEDAKSSRTYQDAIASLDAALTRYPNAPNATDARTFRNSLASDAEQAEKGLVKVGGRWVSREEAQWADIVARGAQKSPPDEDAAKLLVTQAANIKVKGMIDGGTLVSADPVATIFEYRKSKDCDAVASVFYEFTFYTQGGLLRKNRGYLYFYHDPARRDWFNSDTNIDGLPRN